MQVNFAASLKRVLVHEGGRVDDPQDPGGRTNQGVTQRVYAAYRVREGLAPRDVWLMADLERDEIYDAQYWDAVKGDKLPPGIDYVVFDGAVNSGPQQSVKWLQRALGVKADGVIGQITLEAIESHPDHDKLIAATIDRRMAFLHALKTWPRFGKGWTARILQVEAAGQAMAFGSVGLAPVHVPEGAPKATIEDAKKAPSTMLPDAGTGAAAASAAGITWLKDQLEAYVGAVPHLDTAVAVVGITGVVLTGAGAAWAWYARRKAAELADALDTAVPA